MFSFRGFDVSLKLMCSEIIITFFITGSMAEAPHVTLKEERMDPVEAESNVPPCVSSLPVPDPVQRASPPSPSRSSKPVVIKQEPKSPVHVSSDPDPLENTPLCAHSTTPELPVAPAAAPPPGEPLQ